MSVSKLARLTQRKTAVCVTNDLFQWSQVRGRKKEKAGKGAGDRKYRREEDGREDLSCHEIGNMVTRRVQFYSHSQN